MLEESCESKNIVSVNDKEKKERGFRRIVNLSKLERSLNDKLNCKCHVNDVVEDFISHCCAFDADKYEQLAGLYKNYKHKKENV